MFERYELGRDMGDIEIRAFCRSEMIVTTIDYHDLEYILCDRSIKIDDRPNYVERNIGGFLQMLWEKFSQGEGHFVNGRGLLLPE